MLNKPVFVLCLFKIFKIFVFFSLYFPASKTGKQKANLFETIHLNLENDMSLKCFLYCTETLAIFRDVVRRRKSKITTLTTNTYGF